MAATLEGEWVLDRNENYDEFLKASGMGGIKRAIVVKLGGSLAITLMGDSKVKVKAVNGPQTRTREMPLGVDFDDETEEGISRGSVVIEDGKIVGRFTTPKGKKFVMTREIQNDLLVQTMNIDGTECKRYYKKKA